MNQSKKKVGIWMDHASANIMEYTSESMVTSVVTSQTDHHKQNSTDTSENKMNNVEQHKNADFYKRLGETILKYDEVLLFGPTDAKVELFNFLRTDHHFEKIKIDTKQADKMTENQQHAFVLEYFDRF